MSLLILQLILRHVQDMAIYIALLEESSILFHIAIQLAIRTNDIGFIPDYRSLLLA